VELFLAAVLAAAEPAPAAAAPGSLDVAALSAAFSRLRDASEPGPDVFLQLDLSADVTYVGCLEEGRVLQTPCWGACARACTDLTGLSFGVVGVTRALGAQARSETELALVLAHELGHLALQHPRKRLELQGVLWQQWQNGLEPERHVRFETELYGEDLEKRKAWYLEYRREVAGRWEDLRQAQEREADEFACALARRAGYSPASGPRHHVEDVFIPPPGSAVLKELPAPAEERLRSIRCAPEAAAPR
jgi:Zn-dependent protease with chaperone function